MLVGIPLKVDLTRLKKFWDLRIDEPSKLKYIYVDVILIFSTWNGDLISSILKLTS